MVNHFVLEKFIVILYRHMFPVLSVSVRGLDPGRLYSIWLHVTASDDLQAQGQGQGHLGQRSAPTVKPFMHPYSPMRGLAWMKVKVTFHQVKLVADSLSTDKSCVS